MHKILLAGVSAIALTMTASANAQEFKFPKGEGAFSWDALQAFADAHKDLAGQKLTIWGPWREGGDQEQFLTVLAYFEDATGVDVEYGSSENYEQQAQIDAAAGSSANITLLPQPGLLADMASKGYLVPLGDDMKARVENEFAAGSSFVSLGTYKDKAGTPTFYAVPYKSDLKSLVWYSPDNFADAGYAVPETFEDLIALTDKIVADGKTPWCIGLGSGGATGWPATDWIEDLMLRTQSPEDYDAWVSNDLKFNDPKVVEASSCSARSPRTTRRSPAALPLSARRTSARARWASSRCRRPASCTTRLPSSRPSSRKAPCWARTLTSSTSRPLRARISASRCSAPAWKPPSPRTPPAAHAFIDFLMNLSPTRSGWHSRASSRR